ncbi:hypothetical protein PTTG_01308 [Puccinia triticina 1-1 BBBD Race 1]|uniref:Histone-lysine N-methyltransferase n=1 Tax=Puccinia triticina (isolate 1-1 / race 1 (BBBD)) TaxID=630390 RepID=A0A180GZ45_PUCT1|nr:hypothetical protein PTTG_01308 [Puccinia triticina 1-1 BBBD Race 1]
MESLICTTHGLRAFCPKSVRSLLSCTHSSPGGLRTLWIWSGQETKDADRGKHGQEDIPTGTNQTSEEPTNGRKPTNISKMWRPGKWVYIDDEPNDSSSAENNPPNHENSNEAVDPPSPPWKLGQVPVETAIFKDGRRMSRRFNHKNSTTPPPQSNMSKKARRKSTGQVTSNNASSTATQPSADNNNSKSSRNRRKSHAQIKESASNTLLARPDDSQPQASGPTTQDSTEREPSNREPNQTSTGPVSPNTTSPPNPLSDQDPPLTLQAHLSDLKHPSKSRGSFTTTDDLPHSIPDFNSVTEAQSAGPRTPPAIEFSSASVSDRRASAPPSGDLLLPPPLKKFKPWEALKSFQTDGSDVAGDMKLIQEGHQKMLETDAQRRHSRQQRKRASAPPNAIGSAPTTDKGKERNESSRKKKEEPGSGVDTMDSQQDLDLSSSSDLTELSSTLSDLSEEEFSDNQQHSSSSSVVYSEIELEDDCLPDVLVRKVRRPSRPGTSASPQKTMTELIKWKKRKAAVCHLRERKAALRSLKPHSNSSVDPNLDAENWEPPPYIKIKSNIYPFRKPEMSEYPPAICNCTDGGCGEKCLNRAMFYLCDPKLCQLGQACKNLPFNQRKDAIEESSTKLGKGLKVFYTGPIKGWGLKTEIKLKKDRFLIDYRGEIISRDVCYKRVLNEYNGFKHFYLMDYDGSDVIDAGLKGNCARFINHSCTPNLRVERFKLSGLEEYQFGIFTLRDIEIGEELSYDYGWRNFSDIAPTSDIRTSIRSSPENKGEPEASSTRRSTLRLTTTTQSPLVSATAPTVQRCYCGTKGCKGFLGAKKLPAVARPAHATAPASASTSAPAASRPAASVSSSLKRKKKAS